jgi:hypothetical protein
LRLGPYLPIFLTGLLAALIHQKLVVYRFTAAMRYLLDGLALLVLVAIALSLPGNRADWLLPMTEDEYYQLYVYFGLTWAAFIL